MSENINGNRYRLSWTLLFSSLLLKFADEFDGKEDQPVWGVLEQWCAKMVDYTWHIGLLATEHLLQSSFHEFFWWNSYSQVHRQTAKIRR